MTGYYEFPTLQEFHDCLRTGDSTDGWDVMVSFTVKEMNDALIALWSNDAPKFNLKPILDYGMFKRLVHMDIHLGPPSLSFDTTTGGGRAALRIPITGSYQIEDLFNHSMGDAEQVTDDTWDFTMTVPLACMKGDGTLHTDGQPIVFDHGQASTASVVFHFDQGKSDNVSTWKINKVGPASSDADLYMPLLEPHLQAWFEDPANVSGLDYALAQVTNTPDPSAPDATLLLPSSFIFATHGGTPGAGPGETTEGVLSIYIKTVGGCSSPGRPNVLFPPSSYRTKNIFPIPVNQHSSIIISHQLFQEKYLEPRLTQSILDINPSAREPLTINDTSDGFDFTMYLDERFCRQLTPKSIFGGINIDAVNVNLANSPLRLKIRSDAQLNMTAQWTWTSSSTIGWSLVSLGTGQYGEVHLTCTLNLDNPNCAQLESTEKGTTGMVINMEIKDSDWRTTVVASKPSGIDRLAGEVGRIPDELQSLQVTFPGMHISMPELNWFATQSIFAPGKQFALIDNTTPIMAPHDVALVGQMSKPS